MFPRLPGMVFREPRWADEVFVFGYPRVPMTAEMAISVQRGEVVNLARSTDYAVQRGEVVNPATESIPDRDKVFLFSAITRPGNSGGPIVAGDGRVIGLWSRLPPRQRRASRAPRVCRSTAVFRRAR